MATGFRGMPLTGTQAGMVPACQAEGARVAAETRQKEGQMGVLTKIQYKAGSSHGVLSSWQPWVQGRLGWHCDCSLEALDRNVNVTVQSPQRDACNFQVGCLQPTRGPFVTARVLSSGSWPEDRDKDPADCSKFSL
jgi:hypothetical protein